MLAIAVKSRKYGTEIIECSTEGDRFAELDRQMAKAETLRDGVPREFVFGETASADADMDDLYDASDFVPLELAARWDGDAWPVASYGIPNTQKSMACA